MARSHANKGETFVVKVDNCENGTWQGKILWADENRQEHFRSALELMSLMNEALNQEDAANRSDENLTSG